MSHEKTAVCVVDDRGEVHPLVKVATEPELLFAVLKPFVARLRRIGHEGGSLSPWLHPEMLKLGMPTKHPCPFWRRSSDWVHQRREQEGMRWDVSKGVCWLRGLRTQPT